MNNRSINNPAAEKRILTKAAVGPIRAQVVSSVGVPVAGLSDKDKDALLSALLYKVDAVDENGKIRPLEKWL